MGVFGAPDQACTFNYLAGDVGYVPFAIGHYIENTYGAQADLTRAGIDAADPGIM
jgi:oxalate decarboxylase/phosphoglucose isomerase-like protein (cupin superfamily)